MEEGVNQDELNKIENEIKEKELNAELTAKKKIEEDIREQINKEQELIDLKNSLALANEERSKAEKLVLEQKKQHEEEVVRLNKDIGSSKAVHTQSQVQPSMPQKLVLSDDDISESNKESQQKWEEYLDNNKTKFRG